MIKILAVTASRSDFGKMKSVLNLLAEQPDFDFQLFVTGVHIKKDFGNSLEDVLSSFSNKLHVMTAGGEIEDHFLTAGLPATLRELDEAIRNLRPAFMILHGDRIDSLLAAALGNIYGIRILHIEGGEFSGNIDENFRHAITKLSHHHFVSNTDCTQHLLQLGEWDKSISVVGAPEMDTILSDDLPGLEEIKGKHNIPFSSYAVVLLHPENTGAGFSTSDVNKLVNALLKTGINYLVVEPNDEKGHEAIRRSYKLIEQNDRFLLFDHFPFEDFVVLSKHAQFGIGNSSAFVKEYPTAGVPVIIIGNRQSNRAQNRLIAHSHLDESKILTAIEHALSKQREPVFRFGNGNTAHRILWKIREVCSDGPVAAKAFYSTQYEHATVRKLTSSFNLFLDFLDGKRVAVVGPAPYLLNNRDGGMIDSYDVVIRLNQGAILCGLHPEAFGVKTDAIISSHVFLNGLSDSAIRRLRGEIEYFGLMYSLHFYRNIYPSKRDILVDCFGRNFFAFQMCEQRRFEVFGDAYEKILSTGTEVLCQLLRSRLKQLLVIGFSFNFERLKREPYYADGYAPGLNYFGPYHEHEDVQERAFLKAFLLSDERIHVHDRSLKYIFTDNECS